MYYYDRNGDFLLQETDKEVGRQLKSIKKLIGNITDEKRKQLALDMLIYARHLVKDSGFANEQEMRMLVLRHYGDDLQFTKGDSPLLYEDYLPIMDARYLKEITAGPKLPKARQQIEVWKQFLKLKGLESVKCSQSTAPLA
jgi:hypothetical protein